jgi:FdhD protein
LSSKNKMPKHPGLAARQIHRFREGVMSAAADVLAVEEPLDIRITSGGSTRSVAITMRTPGRDEDLARGFLFTEGVLPAGLKVIVEIDKENVVTVTLPAGQSVDWKRLERHSYTSSSCGVCGKTSLEQVYAAVPYGDAPGMGFQVAPEVINLLPAKLRAAQELFEKTGGIHAAGLFDHLGNLLHFAEDVGRHNALDKLIGYASREGLLPLDQHLLLLSGRASFELIQKAAMAGIGLVAAVGAPSSLAADLAEEMGVTLCGFVRNGAFNVYCGEERVVYGL